MRITQASEQSKIIYPTMDTMTDSQFPDDQPYYTNTILQVGKKDSVGTNRYGFYKFDMNQSIQGTINITSATFYLYCTYAFSSNDGYYTVKGVDLTNETWTDSTITWNNQPTLISNESTLYDQAIAGDWLAFPVNITTLRDSYSNNETKTYVLWVSPSYSNTLANFNSIENSEYHPKLLIYYTISESDETLPTPEVSNAALYTLLFYATEDSMISSATPSTNYGSSTTCQIKYSGSEGVYLDYLCKFNVSTPDLINGVENTVGFSLYNVSFDINQLYFCQRVEFFPTSQNWQPFNIIKGVSRANESWNEDAVTWNSKPAYRSGSLSLPRLINEYRNWNFSIVSDENFIRFSIQNQTSYTVVHSVDVDSTFNGFSDWYTKEQVPDPNRDFTPYLEMQVYLTNLTLPAYVGLTFSNADLFFGNSLGIGEANGGYLLSALMWMAFVVPIYWITKKSMIIFILSLSMLTFFLVCTWIGIAFYSILFIFTIITLGLKVKRWLS